MEEIFNKIIEIDNNAKAITNFEKEKKSNIEEYIESEFRTKKVVLDMEFKDNLEIQKKKYDDMLQEKKNEIDEKVKQEIKETEKIYKEKEAGIIENIINIIKKGDISSNEF